MGEGFPTFAELDANHPIIRNYWPDTRCHTHDIEREENIQALSILIYVIAIR